MVSISPYKTLMKDKLHVEVYTTRKELGKKSAENVANKIKEFLKKQNEVRVVFAAAPSQNEFLYELAKFKTIEWNRVIAFHMDEYIGLDSNAPQLFSSYLKKNIFQKIPFKEINIINPNNNPEEEYNRYGKLISQAPIDIVCMGVGENGHIAFNDPPVADFNDSQIIKIVELDKACRTQQVNDGCFVKIEDVPRKAITLTIPTLMSAKYLSIVVPGQLKAPAVIDMLYGEISTKCPASILRTHENAFLYVDLDAYRDLSYSLN
jgi:glucosamine-6-phosphate deaminase